MKNECPEFILPHAPPKCEDLGDFRLIKELFINKETMEVSDGNGNIIGKAKVVNNQLEIERYENEK